MQNKKCLRCPAILNTENSWDNQSYCKNCQKELKREWQAKQKSTPEGRRKRTIDSLYQNTKRRAKKKNIVFSLTKKDIDEMLGEECPVLGIKYVFCDTKIQDASPSIDKIIPELGYVKTNVQIISCRANSIKNNGTLKEFEKILEYMEG